MQQSDNIKVADAFRSPRKSEPAQQNMKDIIAVVHQKKMHYKKALSLIDSSLQNSNLKYLFNGSNSIIAVTPEQKQILKDEHLARGSLPQFQLQNELNQNHQKLRLKIQVKQNKSLKKRMVGERYQLKRYRTEGNQQLTHDLKRSILCTPTKQLPSLPKNQQYQNKLRIGLAQLRRTNKNTQKLQRIYTILGSFNPFFAKIEKAIGVCLLRVGDIIELNNHQILYDISSTYSIFYVILDGQVRLKGPQNMHKVCSTGETLLQQALFQQRFNGALQKAIAIHQVLILSIQIRDYDKLVQQFFKFGFKQGAQELNSLIRRNYIVKNWLRNKFRHIYNN